MKAVASPRELGLITCIALVMGNTIGMGIFVLPAALAPYGSTGLWGWLLTIGGCLALALVFARLAQRLGEADGPYAYIHSQLGELPAFIALWCYWISVLVTHAFLAIAVVGYLQSSFTRFAAVPAPALAWAAIWLFVLVNACGVRTGGRVAVLTTALKLVPLLTVIGLAGWFWFSEPTRYGQPAIAAGGPEHGLLAAATLTLFAMLGIESATLPAGRVRDPARTIPRATLIGTVLTGLIYLLVCAIPLYALPQTQLAASTAPFVDLIDHWLGAGSGRWIGVFVLISGLGALNGWTLIGAELTATFARQRILPARLATPNRFAAPWAGLVLGGGIASGLVAMNYSQSLAGGYGFLLNMVTAASLPVYLFCSLALLQLWQRGSRPAAVDLLAIGLAGLGYAVLAGLGIGGEALAWSLALMAAGLPLYLLLRWRNPRLALES